MKFTLYFDYSVHIRPFRIEYLLSRNFWEHWNNFYKKSELYKTGNSGTNT